MISGRTEQLVAECLLDAAERFIIPFADPADRPPADWKTQQEIVTSVDVNVEAWLTEQLPRIGPGVRVVGEEAASGDDSLTDGRIARGGHDPLPARGPPHDGRSECLRLPVRELDGRVGECCVDRHCGGRAQRTAGPVMFAEHIMFTQPVARERAILSTIADSNGPALDGSSSTWSTVVGLSSTSA